MIRLIIFDMDGVLTNSKQRIEQDSVRLLNALTVHFDVAIISGSTFQQMCKQLVPYISKEILLLPNSGTELYKYYGRNYQKVYGEKPISDIFKELITDALNEYKHLLEIPKDTEIYGEQIECRGTQITFSALGQDAPLSLKTPFDPNGERRQRMVDALDKKLGFYIEFNIGGTTSIDATRRGMNKGHGIEQLMQYCILKNNQLFFVGDQLGKLGNDYSVVATGVPCFRVFGVQDAKNLMRYIGRTLSPHDYPEVVE